MATTTTNTKTAIVEKANQDASLVINNSFIDALTHQLKEKEEKCGLVFPKDYSPATELNGAYLTLLETKDRNDKPVLESCSKPSIANALMTMVTMGVSMSKKQCYPIAYGGKLQLQMSVYGNVCIARRFGLKTISAMCIYDGDTFEYHIENGEIVIDKHTQNFESIDTDKIKGAYAVATMSDGTKHIEIMNLAMLKKAWSQGFGYKEDGKGTHQKFADQMAEKTVKNRCLKHIIRTYGTQMETDAMDEMDSHDGEDKIAMTVKNDVKTYANATPIAEDVAFTEVKEEQPTPKVDGEVVADDDLPDYLKD